MKNVKKGASELVVMSGDRSVDFEMSDHALDPVSLPIDQFVPTDVGLGEPAGMRR